MMNFQKPENALRRAEELLAVGQPEHALQVLHQTIGHRKFRSQGWDGSQEQIMLQYVALCVDLGKLQIVREGLHQYRAIAQVANAQSLGKVLGELRERAEAKLAQAKKNVEDVKCLDELTEDLEAEESPESLLSLMLSIDVRDESAKAVHKSLRMCWECYKMILDILRTTPKQEKVYHETAQKGLEFCKVNSRPQEFKKLCEVIRNHYALLLKYRSKPEYEPLLRPEIHLETRLEQLKVASDLELWRESFQTAEDIFALGIHDLLQSKSSTAVTYLGKIRAATAVYYEKLAQVFWVSDMPLFHAHASIKYMIHNRTFKKDMEPEQIELLSSCSVLAVLSIPYALPDQKMDNPVQVDLYRRLASLLNHPTIPTRESLKAALVRSVRAEGLLSQPQRNILLLSREAVQSLFKIIETQEINPLAMCKHCEPLIAEIENDPKLAQYMIPIKRVVFHKIIIQLSDVYSSMAIEYFTKNICPENFVPWNEAEKIIVNLAYTGLVELRIDYATKAIYFGNGTIDPEAMVRKQLLVFGQQMDDAVVIIDRPSAAERRVRCREEFYDGIELKLKVEAERLRKRNVDVKFRHKIQIDEQRKLEDSKKKLEKERQENEERLETLRRADEQKKREESRRKEEQDRERREAAEAIVEELKKLSSLLSKTSRSKDEDVLIKGFPLSSIDVDKVASGFLAFEDFEKVQREIRIRERQEKLGVRKQQAKRMDHLLRALLEEELPLLDNWEHDRVQEDKKLNQRKEEARQIERENLLKYVECKNEYVAVIQESREEELEKRREAERRLAIEILKKDKIRRAIRRKQEYIEKEKRDKEELQLREQKRQEEERSAKEAMEQQRAEEEKAAKEEKLKQAEEERIRKLKAQEDRQREREREIEERQEKERLENRRHGGGAHVEDEFDWGALRKR